MRFARLIAALLSMATATACTAERSVSRHAAAPVVASRVTPAASELPLLFIVDGNRLFRDQLPLLTADQVSVVEVMKGRAALEKYGPDAAYGVVIVRTKLASARQS
jgi:hypothetical protein